MPTDQRRVAPSLFSGRPEVGSTLEKHAAGEGPLRLQAPSGVYVEIRVPVQPDSISGQASNAGYHSVVETSAGRKYSVRQRRVDFRPPNGCVLCTDVKFDREVMGELSHPRGPCRDEYIEVPEPEGSGQLREGGFRAQDGVAIGTRTHTHTHLQMSLPLNLST